MAAARKCDVCGVFYEPYNNCEMLGIIYARVKPNGFKWVNIDHKREIRSSSEPMDCCETCLGKIEAFIDELKRRK